MPTVAQLQAISDRIISVKNELASKAARDPEFRRSLLADTAGTIEKEYNLPDGSLKGVSIEIVEEKPNSIVVPIPAGTENVELTDDQLEAVAGGIAFGGTAAAAIGIGLTVGGMLGGAAAGATVYGVNRGW